MLLIKIILILGGLIGGGSYFFGRTKTDSTMEKAFKAKESGEFELAINLYTDAIKETPKNWVIYYYRALCKKGQKDLDGAKADLEEAIKIAPKHSQLAKD